MKKRMSILLVTLFCVGCSYPELSVDEIRELTGNSTVIEEATLQVGRTAISATAAAATYSIAVMSNRAWSVSSNATWCTISQTSGTNNGTVMVNVVANTTTAGRSATITVTAGLLTQQVTVTQAAGAATGNNFTETGGGLNFDMIAVAGGTFTMGATSEQGSDALSAERPTHSVTLSNYAIGKYEVTQKLWKDVMGSDPSYIMGDNLPVESVSHDDIQSFLTSLNTKTGKNYRLPTEAEWEYAARGGNQSEGYKYSGSNTIGDVAWYHENSGYNIHIVGTKAPNELGIYDMSGNVSEWCSDWYGSYSSSSQTNPTGGAVSVLGRVYRGGGWPDGTVSCSVSFRHYLTPGYHRIFLGFRLVVPR